METEGTFSVTVVLAAGPRQVQSCNLRVAPDCTAAMAIQQSGLLQRLPQAEVDALVLGVWGRKVTGKHLLQAADRLELYRPLTVDPKVARRERFATQGAKSAGLFAKRRAGAKAGY
jgi:putative ubiquitin-RnfH superfamily antitoxin RatB of RatAB toxin-antitoxin module